MLMFGLHASSPMCGRPDHDDSSWAPASHSARVSVAMIAPMSKNKDAFHMKPKFTGLGKLTGHCAREV